MYLSSSLELGECPNLELTSSLVQPLLNKSQARGTGGAGLLVGAP